MDRAPIRELRRFFDTAFTAGAIASPLPAAGIGAPVDPLALVGQNDPLQPVIARLGAFDRVFVAGANGLVGTVRRRDFDKPQARMWLFGMVTLLEMALTREIDAIYPDGAWRDHLPPARFAKALHLLEARRPDDPDITLEQCLHLADKVQLFMKDPARREAAGFESRRAGERAIHKVETLRNRLAHSHPLRPDDWDAIVILSSRLGGILERAARDGG